MAKLSNALELITDNISRTMEIGKLAFNGSNTIAKEVGKTGSEAFATGMKIMNDSLDQIGSIERIASPNYTLGQMAKSRMIGLDTTQALQYSYLNKESRAMFDNKFMSPEFAQRMGSEDKEVVKAAKEELSAFYKDNAKYDMTRLGVQGIVAGSVAYRVATGGGLYRDKNGEFNIIGIPGI